jgi:hypothetical protein
MLEHVTEWGIVALRLALGRFIEAISRLVLPGLAGQAVAAAFVAGVVFLDGYPGAAAVRALPALSDQERIAGRDLGAAMTGNGRIASFAGAEGIE